MLRNEEKNNEDSGFFTNRPEQRNNEFTFTPHISVNSKILLQRKKEKNTKNPSESPEKAHCSCYGCTAKDSEKKKCFQDFKLSGKSNQAFTQRFIREFNETVKDILHQENSIKLHYIELEEILKRMGFLRNEIDKKEVIGKETLKNSNTKILKQIWSMLLGKQSTWISTRNLLVFLLAVMNVQADAKLVPLIEEADLMKNESNSLGQANENENERIRYGRFSFYGNWELNSIDVNQIHKDYQILYLNKLAHNKENPEIPDEHTYNPEIAEYSKELAENQKKKLVEQFKETIPSTLKSGEDMDYYQVSNFRIAQKEKELEDLRNKHLEEQLQKCTFTPYVSDFKQAEKKLHLSSTFQSKDNSRFNGTSPLSMGKDRYLDLYSLKKLQSEKKDKDFNTWDYEKQCEECTFKPDLEKSRLKSNIFDPKPIYSKGMEKNIERIQNARIEKNLLENLKQKGLSQNENRTKKLMEEVRKQEEKKNLRISGIYPDSSKGFLLFSINNKNFYQ